MHILMSIFENVKQGFAADVARNSKTSRNDLHQVGNTEMYSLHIL